MPEHRLILVIIGLLAVGVTAKVLLIDDAAMIEKLLAFVAGLCTGLFAAYQGQKPTDSNP